MITSIIVATDERGGIGKDNRLPWRLSSDLKRFKQLTMGHHLIVGRKTFESIGKPLPGRRMIVLTRSDVTTPPGCFASPSLSHAIEFARERGESEVFVGGGAEVYRQALPLAQRIYLTRVNAIVNADTFFPELNPADWVEKEVARHDLDDKDQFASGFYILERRR